jgi:hypothetical protein
MNERLRLRATDPEDLAVIAACLQDARVTLKEMVFAPDERRFMAAFVRYRREALDDWHSCDGLTECDAALVFEGVAEVKHRGIDPSREAQVLELLTIATEPGRDHRLHIDLVFAGDAQIQLRTDLINCRLDDFGDPVACATTPCDHLGEGWTGSLRA